MRIPAHLNIDSGVGGQSCVGVLLGLQQSNQIAAFLRLGDRLRTAQPARRRGLGRLARRRTARWRSTAFCELSQNSGVVRKAAASFRAISAVTVVRPLTIRSTTLTSHPGEDLT